MTVKSPDSFMFTVGKLDAGMAILLGERAHLIEFPSLLLPPGATTGSIVNISVTQNVDEERKRDEEFWNLQQDILETFGRELPQPPQISLRNVTQTSVTLEWPPLQLATASLRSLDIYKNGQRLAPIPSPMQNTSTKLSGLDLNTEYTFRLVLRTSAGTFNSNLIRVKTHTMTDTSGISVCFGNVQDSVLFENAKLALQEMRAKWSDKIQIDTTHFVCTTPAATPSGAQASGSVSTAPGVEYQRALQLSIPVVQPHWILACHAEKKMIPIAGYYLGTNPATPFNPAPFTRPQSMSQASLPNSAQSNRSANRASMPAPARSEASPPAQAVGRTTSRTNFEPTPEEGQEATYPEGDTEVPTIKSPKSGKPPRMRHGTMDKEFKFPPPSPVEEPPVPQIPPEHLRAAHDAKEAAATDPQEQDVENVGTAEAEDDTEEAGLEAPGVVAPSSVEVPPPPQMERAHSMGSTHDEADEDVGETEEISLN